MSTEDDKWNLDRVPTRWERIYGSVFSVAIFLLMSLFLYSSSLAFMEDGMENKPWGPFIVSMLLLAGSGYLVLCVAFSKRRKPSQKAIVLIGYLIGGMSCALLALSIIGLGNTPYLASTGLTGLAGSLAIIHQGSRRGNS